MLKISQRIRHYRQKKGLTQEAVATALGVRKENYAKYESGERNPKDDRLVEIAKILDVSYNALTEGVEREFADLLHRHASGAVMDEVDGFYAFYSDVIENDTFKDISEFFALWEEKFKIESKDFYDRFIKVSSLDSLSDLRTLHLHSLNKGNTIPDFNTELETEPLLEQEVTYRLAFCIAMTKYLSETDFDIILDEAGKRMTGSDITPLQFFAVKAFVPYLSYIAEVIEMTMWNSTIDDFELYFLHYALTDFGKEEFDDNSDDGEQP